MNDGGDYMDRDWIIKTVVVEEWKKMGGIRKEPDAVQRWNEGRKAE